jgi:hypothetical protein
VTIAPPIAFLIKFLLEFCEGVDIHFKIGKTVGKLHFLIKKETPIAVGG